MLRVATLIGLAVLLATGFSWWSDPARKNGALVGELAPEIAREDLRGRTVVLSEHRGKMVLLNFWGAYCAPCKKELPVLEKLAGEYGWRGLEVVTVSTDTEADTRQFLLQHGVTLTTVPDPRGEVFTLYGIQTVPATLVVGKDGVVKSVIGAQDEAGILAGLKKAGFTP
jgi:peroxiredoxin